VNDPDVCTPPEDPESGFEELLPVGDCNAAGPGLLGTATVPDIG